MSSYIVDEIVAIKSSGSMYFCTKILAVSIMLLKIHLGLFGTGNSEHGTHRRDILLLFISFK